MSISPHSHIFTIYNIANTINATRAILYKDTTAIGTEASDCPTTVPSGRLPSLIGVGEDANGFDDGVEGSDGDGVDGVDGDHSTVAPPWHEGSSDVPTLMPKARIPLSSADVISVKPSYVPPKSVPEWYVQCFLMFAL